MALSGTAGGRSMTSGLSVTFNPNDQPSLKAG